MAPADGTCASAQIFGRSGVGFIMKEEESIWLLSFVRRGRMSWCLQLKISPALCDLDFRFVSKYTCSGVNVVSVATQINASVSHCFCFFSDGSLSSFFASVIRCISNPLNHTN
jgi:hypothetical protein